MWIAGPARQGKMAGSDLKTKVLCRLNFFLVSSPVSWLKSPQSILGCLEYSVQSITAQRTVPVVTAVSMTGKFKWHAIISWGAHQAAARIERGSKQSISKPPQAQPGKINTVFFLNNVGSMLADYHCSSWRYAQKSEVICKINELDPFAIINRSLLGLNTSNPSHLIKCLQYFRGSGNERLWGVRDRLSRMWGRKEMPCKGGSKLWGRGWEGWRPARKLRGSSCRSKQPQSCLHAESLRWDLLMLSSLQTVINASAAISSWVESCGLQ